MSYPDQSFSLSILSRSPATVVKDFVETLLPALEPVEVLHNSTGLVMLPMQDTAKGTTFYVGEVLVASARVRLAGAEGYAACLGRDLTQALALALLDAACTAGCCRAEIAAFVQAQAAALEAEDLALQHQIEATRVELETF